MKTFAKLAVTFGALSLYAVGCSGDSNSNKDAGTGMPVDAGSTVDAGTLDAGDVGYGVMEGKVSFPLRSVMALFGIDKADGGLSHQIVTLYGAHELDHEALCQEVNVGATTVYSTLLAVNIHSLDGGDLSAPATYEFATPDNTEEVQLAISAGQLVPEHPTVGTAFAFVAGDGGVTVSQITWPDQLVGQLATGGSVDLEYSANLDDGYGNTVPVSGKLHAAGCDLARLQ